jgi:outer membrane protein assembly factor BamA
MLGMVQMAVDNHKVEAVTKWLTDQNVAFAQVSPKDVPQETKKVIGS